MKKALEQVFLQILSFKSIERETKSITLSQPEIVAMYKIDLGQNNRMVTVPDRFVLGCYSGILNSCIAIELNIAIMPAFVLMRQIARNYGELYAKIQALDIATTKKYLGNYTPVTYRKIGGKKKGSQAIRFK